MNKLSLVGLKATDIVTELAKRGAFFISSYNTPIAMVVPVASTKREFYEFMEQAAKELFDNGRKE